MQECHCKFILNCLVKNDAIDNEAILVNFTVDDVIVDDNKKIKHHYF